MYTQLRRTHPRIGKAMYGAYFESDLTGDYPDQRVDQILRHDQALGRCRDCGCEELRTHIRARMLVGPNAGIVHDWYSKDCPTRACANASSNWRPVW